MLATEKVVDKFDKLSLVTFVRCCPMCLNSLTVIIRGGNMKYDDIDHNGGEYDGK